MQVQVNAEAGFPYLQAIRAACRSDLDVIMVGELRDPESMNLVQQLALTGHLVFTALHAEDAARALVRLVDVGVDAYVVGEATRSVVAQRLVRTLCPECSVEADPPAELAGLAEATARTGGLEWPVRGASFRRATGCLLCAHTGYRGRELVGEVLEVTPRIAAALRRGAGPDEIRELAVGQGMTTLGADGVRRAAEGLTTLEEVARSLGLR